MKREKGKQGEPAGKEVGTVRKRKERERSLAREEKKLGGKRVGRDVEGQGDGKEFARGADPVTLRQEG